jgi:hypothetical protein
MEGENMAGGRLVGEGGRQIVNEAVSKPHERLVARCRLLRC